jgi:glutathione S-transferase
MKLYYAPGACSIGIHVLLEEIGKPYEAVAVNLREGAQHKPEFTGVNPKSTVPTLVRDDGSVHTEYPAIAYWLAATNPEAGLMPATPEDQCRALEATDYIDTVYRWVGAKATSTQERQWPRTYAYDQQGYSIDGVPQAIKDAVAYLAARVLAGDALLPDESADTLTGDVKSYTVEIGEIRESTEFAGGARKRSMKRYPKVDAMLRAAGLLEDGSRAYRG